MIFGDGGVVVEDGYRDEEPLVGGENKVLKTKNTSSDKDGVPSHNE